MALAEAAEFGARAITAAVWQTIHTSRLVLRPPETSDAEAVFRSYSSAPEVTRFMPWPAHRSVAEAQEYLRIRIEGCRNGTHLYWLMVTEAEIIGIIGLRLEGDSAEVGFALAPREWDKGYATEALKAVLEVGLGLPTIRRVWGYCDCENPASARVMEKAGMTREGLLRRFALFSMSDEPRDCWVYAKVR